jgi:uncharacterized protein
MARIDRRGFMRRGAAVVGGVTLGSSALDALVARAALDPDRTDVRAQAALGEGGYGPLAPKAATNDGKTYITLPAGFEYVAFGHVGSIMSDGNPTPRAHDGMAAFALPNGNVRLIRNHEDREAVSTSTARGDLSKSYDAKGGGGTTSLEFDPVKKELVRDFYSLSGTIVNCAGGSTPWNSWMTCEETTAGKRQGWQQEHGYVFDVPVSAEDEVEPKPLKQLGRFAHEALCVDPANNTIYLTEDQSIRGKGTGSGFYRYIPRIPAARGGKSPLETTGSKLQMLAIRGGRDAWQYVADEGQQVGKSLPVRWVDIDDPDPANASLNPLAVFQQGYEKGGCTFNRLEGCWWGNDKVYFISTNGGDASMGQVWEYDPKWGGSLKLLFESTGAEVLDAPDNICVSPRGGLVLCEDGGGVQYMRGLTEAGMIFDFSLNVENESEFAGACFSPDGKIMFVNIFGESRPVAPSATPDLSVTLAIWGPWEKGAL